MSKSETSDPLSSGHISPERSLRSRSSHPTCSATGLGGSQSFGGAAEQAEGEADDGMEPDEVWFCQPWFTWHLSVRNPASRIKPSCPAPPLRECISKIPVIVGKARGSTI